MSWRRNWRLGISLRPLLVAVLAGFLMVSGAGAQTLLPRGFFDALPSHGKGPAGIEADILSYDSNLDIVTAQGNAVMSYKGYVLTADSLVFNQRTQEVRAVGHVTIRDPAGTTFEMDSFELTGGMKEAFLKSLTLTTAEGAMVTADDVHHAETLQTILTRASYAPCGLCIDSKGRKIGWRVKSARMIYNRETATVVLEQPSLELLGIPVAWFPWLAVPDPTQPRATGFRMPSLGYTAKTGAGLTVPYFTAVGADTDFIFSPTLMSRQGLLLGAEWTQRFAGLGEIDIRASGLYQLDRAAFAGTVGDRDWRGAIQTSGAFTPVAQWTVGWSYSVFSDAAYLTDYSLPTAASAVNQAYVTHLSPDYYADLRVQQFVRLGNYTAADQDEQGMALPGGRFESVTELGPDRGRIEISADLLAVTRLSDQTDTFGAVPYVFGYEGNKAHLKLEAAWQGQWILPGGVAATPYLGGRLDAASYDGASSDPGAPLATSLLSLTPIAAMDFRWPLVASNGLDTHLLEPIAQLVYRGSATTDVGITNDTAQSFVFDDTNLFSYNRFSGSDRQETGLRANFGAHYQGNFDNGGWIDVIAGQSFHLAGTNAMGIADAAQTGTSSGLGTPASHVVLGARGAFPNGLQAGGKLMLDPAGPTVARAGLGLAYAASGYSAGLDYVYIAADAALGIGADQHEIAGRVGVPVMDYWTLKAGLGWDLDLGSWQQATAGATYDDGYLAYGVDATVKPASFALAATFKLKGPDGQTGF